MEKLTKEQARTLARAFKESALSVGAYIVKEWNSLTEKQRSDVQALEWSLMNASEDMLTLATKLAMQEIAPALEEIVKATKDANRAVKNINNVKKAISVIASLVALGGAIISKDPNAIVKSLKSVYDEIKPEKKKEKEKDA